MKPTTKPKRTAEQRAEEEAVRRQHAANPVRQRPAGAINRQSFAAILRLVARFCTLRDFPNFYQCSRLLILSAMRKV